MSDERISTDDAVLGLAHLGKAGVPMRAIGADAPLAQLSITIERPIDGQWSRIYDLLRAAYEADEIVPITLRDTPPVTCKVMSWHHDLDSATFRLLAKLV